MKIKFVGTNSTYVYGPYRFLHTRLEGQTATRGANVIEVTEEAARHLLAIRKSGANLFKRVEDKALQEEKVARVQAAEDTELRQKRAAKMVRDNRVGQFLSKADAVVYARDTHGVILDTSLSIRELNAQTATLHSRFTAGAIGVGLVVGLKKALLVGGAPKEAKIKEQPAPTSVEVKNSKTFLKKPKPEAVPETGPVPGDDFDSAESRTGPEVAMT